MGDFFQTITTERLVIRPFRHHDVDQLHARRNHPEIARLQYWEYPHPLEESRRLVEFVSTMGGPENDEWWMAVVCEADGTAIGDLAVNLTWDSRTAEVGYSLDREQWGKGYAAEALAALVDYLFDIVGVTRVFGMLDPANVASAMVLERTGFLYEGRTRSSYRKTGEVSDDLIYGMLRDDRDTWRDRPTTPPNEVGLIEVTTDNCEAVARLKTHESQKRFVALTSWEEGRGSPRPSYERYAFKPTGRIVDEETEALLVFD